MINYCDRATNSANSLRAAYHNLPRLGPIEKIRAYRSGPYAREFIKVYGENGTARFDGLDGARTSVFALLRACHIDYDRAFYFAYEAPFGLKNGIAWEVYPETVDLNWLREYQ